MSGGRSSGPSAAALICGVTAGGDGEGDLAGLACLAALSPALGSMGWGHSPFLGDVLPGDPTSQALGLRGGRGQRAPAPGVQAAWIRQLADMSGCWVLPHLPGCFLGDI